MLRFSSNDPNQRYYLNGMWKCGPSVLILCQWFQSQFSSNEKLHFTQGCCIPRDFELKRVILIFLPSIVLQTDSLVSMILRFVLIVLLSLFKQSLVLQTVGPTQQYDYRCSGQEQFIASPTFCRTMDTLVETSVSWVLLSVLLLICASQEHCIVSFPSGNAIDTLVKTSASLVDLKCSIFSY